MAYVFPRLKSRFKVQDSELHFEKLLRRNRLQNCLNIDRKQNNYNF